MERERGEAMSAAARAAEVWHPPAEIAQRYVTGEERTIPLTSTTATSPRRAKVKRQARAGFRAAESADERGESERGECGGAEKEGGGGDGGEEDFQLIVW